MKDITNDKIGPIWATFLNAALKGYKMPVTAEEIELWRANFYAGAYAAIRLVFAPFAAPAEASPQDICDWLIELKVELELEIATAATEATKAHAARQAIQVALRTDKVVPIN